MGNENNGAILSQKCLARLRQIHREIGLSIDEIHEEARKYGASLPRATDMKAAESLKNSMFREKKKNATH